MNQIYEMLEFDKIIEQCKEFALTEEAKKRFDQIALILNQKELIKRTQDTTEARVYLERFGTPPFSFVKYIRKTVDASLRGELLTLDELEEVRQFAVACERLSLYLKKGEEFQLTLNAYSTGFHDLSLVKEEIERCIRSGRVDDYASKELRNIRRHMESVSQQIKQKLESILRSKKECFSEGFVSNRSGHYTLPVKKEYKHRISGNVIAVSSSKATYFIEPAVAVKLREELEYYRIEESNEERKILFMLSSMVADASREMKQNLDYMEELDYIFAKGKLSLSMNGIPAKSNTSRIISLKEARHPLLNKKECVPLTIEMGNTFRGVVITGPNTGGKTVALKTAGLLSVMAQSGLHVSCEQADICMNSQVLCDIGDGQNISENLSTFSSHIKNIIAIIQKVDKDSLVLLDELGSGTDPLEGMGIAISILEELKISGCNFIATTHYPEVKQYAKDNEKICNARMTFDKESLKPLYQLELGEAGESCALYIAKQLGFPKKMLQRAYEESYVSEETKHVEVELKEQIHDQLFHQEKNGEETSHSLGVAQKKENKIQPLKEMEGQKTPHSHVESFQIGDCVEVEPDKKLGIVYQTANEKGIVGVQIQKEKQFINHKRLKKKIDAKEMYPEDYDFSVIFEDVKDRKAKKLMQKRHVPGLVIERDADKNKR